MLNFKSIGIICCFCTSFLNAQIGIEGSFSNECKAGASAELKIHIKKFDLKDYLLLQIETPPDFFIQSKDLKGGNLLKSEQKNAIEWSDANFPSEQEFDIVLNVLAPDVIPQGSIRFTTKVAFMLGETEKNESLAPIIWNTVTSLESKSNAGNEPVSKNDKNLNPTSEISKNTATGNGESISNTPSVSAESVSNSSSYENPQIASGDSIVNDSLTKLMESKKRQNFDLDSLKQFGVGDKLEVVVQQMTQLRIDAKEVRRVGEEEFRIAKTASEKETAERILKVAIDMETEALELERLLANVTYTYSDDIASAKTNKNQSNNKNISKNSQPIKGNSSSNGTANNSNQTDVITNNQVASSNSLKPKKQRQIVTEEMDESAKSIRDQSEYYYRVQIGAFKLKPTKIPFQNKLKNWQLLTDARGIYRIQVGIYKTKAEALNYQAELQSMGIPQSFVVKVSK